MYARRELPEGPISWNRIEYQGLNDRQKENFNFAKLSAVLADYGYITLRLSDDWKGADLIAVHSFGGPDLRIQLKGRLTVDKKYQGKGLHIAFRDQDHWYIYPHDAFLEHAVDRIKMSISWVEKGLYHWPSLPVWARTLLSGYVLEDSDGESGCGQGSVSHAR